MIFSFYQNQTQSNDQQKSPQNGFCLDSKSKQQNLQHVPDKQKQRFQNLNWIRKKSTEQDQFHSPSPINISISFDAKNNSDPRFFIKSPIVLITKQIEQNPQRRVKRLYSESLYSQQKKRKSQYSKFFNQTFVDNQHNFIGKNYLRQVKNCKLHPKTYQSLSNSRKKSIIQKKAIQQIKESKFQTCQNARSTHVFNYKQKLNETFQLRKKFSLNEALLTTKSPSSKQKNQEKQNAGFVNKSLMNEIENKVKNDIKTEMKIFKKFKLNKYKLKYNQEKPQKKNLLIQNNLISEINDSPQSTADSPEKNLGFLARYSDSDIKIKNKIKGNQKSKKPHTSFYSYNDQPFKCFQEIPVKPISEDLKPWQSDHTDFYGFR